MAKKSAKKPKATKKVTAKKPTKNSYKPVVEHLKDAEACLNRALSGAIQNAEKEPGKWSRVKQQIDKGRRVLAEFVEACPED